MRQHICTNCGKIFLAPTTDTILCPECSSAIHSGAVLRPRICTICGKEYLGYPRSKYCTECREGLKKKWRKTAKIPIRPLGGTDFCEACGKPYIVKGSRQKYCPDCAKTVVQENIRAHKREYMRAHPEFREHMREKKLGNRICVICGKPIPTGSNSVTCSKECAQENARRRRVEADVKRGRLSPERLLTQAEHPHQSGVPGITWCRGKWQLTMNRKYCGIYESIEEAENAKIKFSNAKKGATSD
jgi:predicted nucleic acid-binding Zn ribbon protein